MITKQVEIKLFSYDELSEKARERVRELMEPQHDWWDFVYEGWQEKLAALGYSDVEIQFSGFWSQGDGASFTASVNLEEWIKANKYGNRFRLTLNAIRREYVDSVAKVIRTSSHYLHYNTVKCDDISFTWACEDISSKVEDQLETIREWITEEVREKSKEIYRDLEAEYNGLTSEEYIREECTELEYLFYSSGRLFSVGGCG